MLRYKVAVNMKIFLTGASGYVGNYILRDLVKAGYEVNCLIRKGSEKKLRMKGKKIKIFYGDITDSAAVAKAMKGCKAVINLVAIRREHRKQTFENVIFGGTKNCVDAAKKHGIKRFIQMSVLGAKRNAETKFWQAKWEAEEYVRKSDLTYTIFRPSFIFSKEDISINEFARLIKKFPVFPIFGDGEYKSQPVYVEDVSAAFAKAIKLRDVENGIFEVGGPKKYTFNELIATLETLVNKKVVKLNVLLWIAYPIVSLIQFLPNAPITMGELKMLTRDNVCNEKKFAEIFKIKLTPLEKKFKGYHK